MIFSDSDCILISSRRHGIQTELEEWYAGHIVNIANGRSYSFQYLSGFGILGAIAVFVDVSSSSSR